MAAALALAKAGISVKVIGKHESPPPTRTVALWAGSLQLLKNLGIWERVRAVAEPLVAMRIFDATGSLFSLPPVEFHAAEIGREGFGFNIANADLVAALLDAARANPCITLHDGLACSITRTAETLTVIANGQSVHHAALLIGAEGSLSPSRQSAGIATRQWHYPQMAITAILQHRLPHHDVSTEFHTRAGPCTLVPLASRGKTPHRSSLVWLMSPAEAVRRADLTPEAFAGEVEDMTRSLLGRFSVEGARGAFPMRGMVAERFGQNRIMLVGEAAHAFPPIGAQGLNLGLRDVGVMADIVGAAWNSAQDCGSDAMTARYHEARASDVALRTGGVDLLNRSLLAPYLPMDFLRGAGLMALASVNPLRRAIMRTGLGPHNLPPLMRPPTWAR